MDKAVTMEQALEHVRKCQEELEGKQDALTGTPGQVVGFDAEGKAVAQPAPSGGMTRTEADGRYLKLTGGTITGVLVVDEKCSFRANSVLFKKTTSSSQYTYFYDGYTTISFVNESWVFGKYGTKQKGEADRITIGPPSDDYHAANKKYVDDAIAALVARIAALEAK